jgi:uncharacterized membrane protein (Fun14 family)
LGLLDELLRFMGEGSIAGLPPFVVMAIPLVLGLIVGFFLKKFLKKALIAALIIAVITYLGLFSLTLNGFTDIMAQYGPLAIHYVVLLLGMLPLTIGFVLGFGIGFLFG